MGFMVCPIMCVGRWGSWSVPLCVLGDGVHGLSHYVCWEMGFMVCLIMCVGRWGSWSVPLCVLGDGVHGLSHYVCWEMGFMVWPIMCVGRWGSWSDPLCVQEIGELREQLRDVMFYLEAQDKLATTADVSQEEIQDGQVIVGAAAAPETGGKKRSKKRR